MGLSNEKSKFRMLSDKGKISTIEMLTIPDSDNDLEVIL